MDKITNEHLVTLCIGSLECPFQKKRQADVLRHIPYSASQFDRDLKGQADWSILHDALIRDTNVGEQESGYIHLRVPDVLKNRGKAVGFFIGMANVLIRHITGGE